MEPRKIIIINSRNQSQSVIANSTATTLGELKSEMRASGISYEGNTFYCGQMRAELKDDAAPLPETVLYRGQQVRDLTFMLTTPDKKIKSGAGDMTRAEIYSKIKELGLGEKCKSLYGKNFTQCSTFDLLNLIRKAEPQATGTKAEPAVKEAPKAEEKAAVNECKPCGNCACQEALKILLNALFNTDIIDEDTYYDCTEILNGENKVQDSDKMSKQEIDSMFDFVDR